MTKFAGPPKSLNLHVRQTRIMSFDVDVLVVFVRDYIDQTIFNQADDGLDFPGGREMKRSPAIEIT